MTKKDLVRSVAEGLDVDQKQAQTIVQRVLDTVLATLAAQGRVELRNFGVFEVRRRVARKARNPRTGEKVDVAERPWSHSSRGRRCSSGSRVGPSAATDSFLASHLHRHQEIRRQFQTHVLTTFKIELARLFAAETQSKESLSAQESNRTYDSVRVDTLGVGVVELDDQIVRLMHGSVD